MAEAVAGRPVVKQVVEEALKAAEVHPAMAGSMVAAAMPVAEVTATEVVAAKGVGEAELVGRVVGGLEQVARAGAVEALLVGVKGARLEGKD